MIPSTLGFFMSFGRASIAAFISLHLAVAAYGGDGTIHRMAGKVPNSYIVILNRGERAADLAREVERRSAGKVTGVMEHLGMVAIQAGNEAGVRGIASDPRVAAVQENGIFHLADGTCRTLQSDNSQWALAHLNWPDWTRYFSAVFGASLSSVRLYVIDGPIDDSGPTFEPRRTITAKSSKST